MERLKQILLSYTSKVRSKISFYIYKETAGEAIHLLFFFIYILSFTITKNDTCQEMATLTALVRNLRIYVLYDHSRILY